MVENQNKYVEPFFSIIIPVYNIEKYLQECVDSLLFQEFKNFEIILVDDGSSDGSGRLCDELAGKYSQISVIHKENSGTASARNVGVELATGEYLWFVDGDDLVMKDALFVLNDLLNCNKNISVCNFSRIEFIDGESYEQPVNRFYETKKKVTVYDNKSEHIPSSVCYSLFKHKFILNTGITFNENNRYEDEFFNLDLYTNFKFQILSVDYPLYIYRIQREYSKTNSQDSNSLFSSCVSLVDLFEHIDKIHLDSFNTKIIRYKKRGYAEVGLFFLMIYLRREDSLKKGNLLKLFTDKINLIPIEGTLFKRSQIPRLLYNLNLKIFLLCLRNFKLESKINIKKKII